MSKVEMGLGFRSEPNEAYLQKTAKAAGKYGFDVITVYEDLGDQSPMYPLMTFARHNKDSRVGPAGMVVPKYQTMEPIVGDIARLQQMNGNVLLGLVPGAWMNSLGLRPATVTQMREAVGSATYLLEKKEEGYEGKFYTVQPGFKVNYETRGKVPVMIGAWGGKMLALAGEVADEVKLGGTAAADLVEQAQKKIQVGKDRVGRTDNVGIVLGSVTVIDRDRKVAVECAKRKAVLYIEAIGEKDMIAMEQFGDEIMAISQAVRNGDIEGAAQILPDELSRRFVMAGNPRDIIRQTRDIFDAGAKRFEFGTPHGTDEIKGIHLLGREVLPYFR